MVKFRVGRGGMDYWNGTVDWTTGIEFFPTFISLQQCVDVRYCVAIMSVDYVSYGGNL